ncbi:eukaryotic translation initiation factor 4 gamma 1-like [Trichomycterus rosablanca]|uniref:eukaryotic translation initiation factor 4 gamma 1-like n=1 Tax=Trichomycterus rosablanca TaxID=2290929 RepID=UPI002F3521E0
MLPRLFINSWIEQKLVVNPSEENLECLCRLLSIVGKDLHEEKDQYLLDLYFSAINKIIQQRKTSSRICCMLQGIVDLRQNNWVPKSDDQGTKTINKVHKVSEKEKPQEKEEQQEAPSIKCCRGRIIKKQDDGLMTVTIRNGTINTSRPSKINKPGATNYNQLDGCGRTCSWGNWSKGGSRGSTDRTSAEENTSAHIRRSYRKNEHCDRDQNKHWNRRDRRYRGQDMRPHY